MPGSWNAAIAGTRPTQSTRSTAAAPTPTNCCWVSSSSGKRRFHWPAAHLCLCAAGCGARLVCPFARGRFHVAWVALLCPQAGLSQPMLCRLSPLGHVVPVGPAQCCKACLGTVHPMNQCDDLNQCSGHGVCNMRRCECFDGWTGADCSQARRSCCWRSGAACVAGWHLNRECACLPELLAGERDSARPPAHPVMSAPRCRRSRTASRCLRGPSR